MISGFRLWATEDWEWSKSCTDTQTEHNHVFPIGYALKRWTAWSISLQQVTK